MTGLSSWIGQVTGWSGLAICRPPGDEAEADADALPDDETAGAPELSVGAELTGAAFGVCEPHAASVSTSAGPATAPNARPRRIVRRRIGVERRRAASPGFIPPR